MENFEIMSINYEINPIFTWSPHFVIVSNAITNQEATFAIIDTKCYVPVVTLLTQTQCKTIRSIKIMFFKKN